MARKNSARRVGRLLYWAPRILSILFILFLALFSFDVISPELTFWEIILGLLIHNIPSFILIIVLAISWKHELVGGIAFILAGIVYIIISTMGTWPQWYLALSWSMIISGPAFFIGILFFLNWKRKK